MVGDDARLEQVVFGRFLSPDARKAFYANYREIEALWEILSPSAELRDYVDTFKQLVRLYAAVRNAYSNRPNFVAELAHKTKRLVEQSAATYGLGNLTKAVTFDLRTLTALRRESGPDEAKVFNLGLAAMDLLAALAKEKEAAVAAARDSTLPLRAFGLYWALKDDAALHAAGVSALEFTEEAQALVNRFPNAAVNADEQRRFRTSLYYPLLRVESHERGRIVDQTLAILLGGDANAGR